jgi:hypothetical protein
VIPEFQISADALSKLRGHPHADWEQLCGAEVDVYLSSQFIRRGLVEAATPDGRMLWLAALGTLGRKLIDKAEGYEV